MGKELVLKWILFCVFAVICIGSITSHFSYRKQISQYEETQGEVVSIEKKETVSISKSSKPGKRKKTTNRKKTTKTTKTEYYMTYRYTVDGVSYSDVEKLSSRGSVDEGDLITIKYNPKDPSEAVYQAKSERLVIGIVFGVMAVFVLLRRSRTTAHR